MREPRVSIVCIFFNEIKYLQEAVDSILAQEFTDFELLLVDDGSTDGSTEIALAYAQDHPDRVRYLEPPGHANRGMSAARNLGLRHARGEFIAVADGDDRWRNGRLREQVAILDAHSEVRRSVADQTGGFEESFTGLYEDQISQSKVFLASGVWFAPQVWLDYRQHGESCSSAVTPADYRRMRRAFLARPVHEAAALCWSDGDVAAPD
ncbi:glycosyltransferase family A protein [Altericroceibacterium xinjiangense]|uniref:glycosyltransferase family A protein n=1 Tax=Altericroceibacterium xinjiangense TaxID=762261 RepID=UPI000F7F6A8B|nr:glycosyltransferase family A protein [Altericroceibacterium xinjiangense]